MLAVWASRRCSSTAWHVANGSLRCFAQLFALIRIEAAFIKIVKTIIKGKERRREKKREEEREEDRQGELGKGTERKIKEREREKGAREQALKMIARLSHD